MLCFEMLYLDRYCLKHPVLTRTVPNQRFLEHSRICNKCNDVLKASSPPMSLAFSAEQLVRFILDRELINACGPGQGLKTTVIAGTRP